MDLFRGLINVALIDVGAVRSGVHWLGDPTLAMASVITANVWRGFPFFGVSFLAAMQTVPQELYDAAAVDGAGSWEKFWRITLPSIKGVVAVVTLLSTIVTLNDFNIVYIMTRGGPGAATLIFAIVFVPMYWIVATSFKTGRQILLSESVYVPRPFTIDNYVYLFEESRFALWIRNSAV